VYSKFLLRKDMSDFIGKKLTMRSFSPLIVVGLHTIFPKKIFTSGAYRDGAGFNLLIYIEMIT